MEMTSSDQRELADETARERVERLLGRYPEISIEESAVILRFLKKGPPLEVGLLSSNEAVKPKLERFRSDHAKEFSLGPRGFVIAVLIIAAVVVAVVLLWDAGVSR